MTFKNFVADDNTTRKCAVTDNAATNVFANIARDTTNPNPPCGYNAVQICNTGSKVAFIKFGVDNTVRATAPSTTGPVLGDTPIPAGAIVVFAPRKAYYSLVCEASDTTTVFVTFGYGS